MVKPIDPMVDHKAKKNGGNESIDGKEKEQYPAQVHPEHHDTGSREIRRTAQFVTFHITPRHRIMAGM